MLILCTLRYCLHYGGLKRRPYKHFSFVELPPFLYCIEVLFCCVLFVKIPKKGNLMYTSKNDNIVHSYFSHQEEIWKYLLDSLNLWYYSVFQCLIQEYVRLPFILEVLVLKILSWELNLHPTLMLGWKGCWRIHWTV